MKHIGLILSLLMGIAAIGCASPSTSTPTIDPTVQPTSTDRLAGDALVPPLPQITAETTEQETADVITCIDTVLAFENSEDGGILRWHSEDGEYTVVEHGDAVYHILRHPDPASTLALFTIRIDSTVPTRSANVVVDLATGAYRELGADYIDDPLYVLTWLPDEQFAWIDEHGEVFTGSLESQSSLTAPAMMTDLWFVSPDRLLARDDAMQFWYFDLTQSAWSQLPAGESEKITHRWIENAAAADDGSYTFFFYQEYSAVLSNDSGTIQILKPFDSPDGYYLTLDPTTGDTIFPPQQIKDTPYWFFPVEWLFRRFAEVEYPARGFIVDSRTGEVLEHEALGITGEVAIYDSYLSPDETWVAVEVVEDMQSLPDRSTARVSQTWFVDLVTGETRVEEGKFAGWDEDIQDDLDPVQSCTEREVTIELSASAD